MAQRGLCIREECVLVWVYVPTCICVCLNVCIREVCIRLCIREVGQFVFVRVSERCAYQRAFVLVFVCVSERGVYACIGALLLSSWSLPLQCAPLTCEPDSRTL